MIVPFRQGIIRYPYSGSIQDFLRPVGSNIDLIADNGPTEVTFAHRNTNYLHIENATITAAWSGFTSGNIYWLYWDIDLQTGARNFGSTEVTPEFGPTEPTSPVTDLHWYDTTNNIMFVYQSGSFSEVVRVFAAKYEYDGSNLFSMAAGLPNLPFAGSQVGLINSQNASGRIIFDDNGVIITRESGELFTTEDQFFATGSQVNAVRLESSVHHATTTIQVAAFDIVKYTAPGKVTPAGYDDIGNSVLAVVLEDAAFDEVTTTMIQGVIANPLWNWQTVGAELWVIANGLLTETDPNISDVGTYPVKRVPIARVLSNKEIIFEQGLGGIGKTGLDGTPASLVDASTTVKGAVYLTADPDVSTFPLAVGDNDTRMTDARTPTPHIHAATDVTFSPSGNLSSGDVQLAIQELDSEKVNVAGDTLTGFLTLNADPTTDLQAATKQYVDDRVSGLLWLDPIHYVNLIDDSLSTPPISPAESDAYIVAGVGTGAWSGLDGKIVVWDGASWNVDTHPGSGLLSDHAVGERFGIAMETTTTPGGTFAGRKNQIAILDSPSTPTWSFYTPVENNAVFVNNDESLHAFHQYAYNDTLTKWVEIAGGGLVVTASEVDFTPVGNIAATDVQAALAELDTEKSDTGHVHAASAITFIPGLGSPPDDLVSTNVQNAITELGEEKAPIIHTHSHPYDTAGQVFGLPDANAVVFRFIATRAFEMTNISKHQAKSGVASTGSAVFDVQVDGISVMSITFATSDVGVFAYTGSPVPSSVTILPGDVVTIVAPGTQDGTLADIAITLNANTLNFNFAPLTVVLTDPTSDVFGENIIETGGSITITGGSGSYTYLWENVPNTNTDVEFDSDGGPTTSTNYSPLMWEASSGGGQTYPVKLTVTDAITGDFASDTASITFEGF